MKVLKPAIANVLKRWHYPLDVILVCVRWYVAYPLSLRNLEEMMAERGIAVDHSILAVLDQPWGKSMVLVALTGWGHEENRQKSHRAGFNAHPVKPVDYAALAQLLATSPAGQQ